MAKTSFKVTHECPYLGIIWSLLKPWLMFLVLYSIFSKRLGTGIENYAFYLIIGIIQWNFLSLAASASMKDIKSNSNLIKSLNFRRELLTVSSVMLASILHIYELVVFLALLLFFGIKPILVILLPIIIILEFFFVLGLCFILSSLVIYFPDLENIWSFSSKGWWFLTPIFYSLSKDNGLMYTINLFNPMYYIINISRDVLIYSKFPQISSVIILLCFSISSFIFGYLIFIKLKNKLAEMV